MVQQVYRTPFRRRSQALSGHDPLTILDAVDPTPVLALVHAYRWHARPGYPPAVMFRAFLASYALNLGSTNDLIRRLREDAVLRRVCGFGARLPHRTTFNRFFALLANNPGVIEECFTEVTDRMREYLPDLGEQVAVDSSAVTTYGNPNTRRKGDPEAAWGVKTSSRAKKDGVEYHYGYKLHMAADANHGLPLAMILLPANRNDSPELPVVTDKARMMHPWLRTVAVIADRGYDARTNFEHVIKAGAAPVILTRRMPGGRLREGVYDHHGVPTCVGMAPMEYVRSDPERGHLFRCAGCHLANRPGHANCRDEVWEHPSHNLRLGGAVRMGSAEWEGLYAKRQTIERTFKSMKQSLRLNRHCYRGQRKVLIHCLLSALVYQATALAHARAGRLERIRWMVRRVA